jgi:hypothetical protein
MFDIDHKAGIMASATALSRIVSMESFQPTNGDDIIKAVCTLRDDFPRRVAGYLSWYHPAQPHDTWARQHRDKDRHSGTARGEHAYRSHVGTTTLRATHRTHHMPAATNAAAPARQPSPTGVVSKNSNAPRSPPDSRRRVPNGRIASNLAVVRAVAS